MKENEQFVTKEKFQVSHLTPLALSNIVSHFVKRANKLLTIKNYLAKVNWKTVSPVYDAFAFSMTRNFTIIDKEINNLHTMFMLQCGYFAKNKSRISGKLVKSLDNREITLISLQKAFDIIDPYIDVFNEILIKAIPSNFGADENEKSVLLSDISEGEDSPGKLISILIHIL